MDWLKNIWNGICNSTPVIAIKNLWQAFTGKDTPDFYTQKDFIQPGFMTGDIVVFRAKNDWFAAAIRKITEKWGNHIAIITSGLNTIEAEMQGVTKDTLTRAFNTNSQLIVFRKVNLTSTQMIMIKGFLNGKIGEPYGADELGNFILQTDYNDKASDFCSELAVDAYNFAGIKISNRLPQASAPGDLMSYFLSEEGKAAAWILVDTYNILESDVEKLTQ